MSIHESSGIYDAFRNAPPKGSGPFYAIVDCNNFYASCERVFNPGLRNKPVVVLSNNDGCVIARSSEAKECGIPMGAPAFKFKRKFKEKGIHVFSSNYALYGDMSARVVQTLRKFCRDVEVYSIDEAFLILEPSVGKSADQYAREIKETVLRWTGLPVSIGISSSKTLAKIANQYSKKEKLWDGVLHTDMVRNFDDYLARTPVGEVWGIGKNHTQFLEQHGIDTALDLKKAPDSWVKRHMHITGLRTLKELRGIPSIAFEQDIEARKGILSSRSFSSPVTSYEHLIEAVSTYMRRAAEKLRSQQSVAGVVHVFLKTNRFSKNQPYYSNSTTIPLPLATDFTPDLIKAGLAGLKEIFVDGYAYQKAGVMLSEIRNKSEIQGNLFTDPTLSVKKKKLIDTIDKLNLSSGRNTITFAINGINPEWTMKQEFKSPAYTTNWNELPIVR